LGASIHRSRSAIRGVCYGSCIKLLCAESQFTLWQSGNVFGTSGTFEGLIWGEYSSFHSVTRGVWDTKKASSEIASLKYMKM
jgi:hypothetical protein